MVKATQAQAAILNAQRQKLMPTAIDMFRPTEWQEEVFLTIERLGLLEILLGGGNRSGKTTCASVAIAAAILDKPITFRDGSKHNMRPPHWRGEGLKIWIVGRNWDHVGKTLYRVLFDPGLFRVIKDRKTHKWRSWNPTDPDEEPFELSKRSPPLIEMRDVKDGEAGISWENKKACQIKSVTMAHDDTNLQFFASSGALPVGDPVHLVWIDEKIEDDNWYEELKVRLIDYRGWLLWTSWPDTSPSAIMLAMRDRADIQAIDPKTQYCFAIDLKGGDNPYTDSDHRDKIFSSMDPEERAARDSGRANYERWKTYWMYSRFTHVAVGPDADADDAVAACLRKSKAIPHTWTRYLILDPGSGHAAVLFVAVPPPFEYFEWENNGTKHKEQFGTAIVPYDEVYIPNLSAEPIAKAVKSKTLGTFFEDFIIDPRAARQTPMGFSGTVGSNYADEFRKQDLRCVRRGSNFSLGSDDVDSRILKTQGIMNIQGNGKPILRVHGCKDLPQQIERYRWDKDASNNPTHKPAKRQQIDLVVCLEYFVSRDDCGYVKPPDLPKLVDQNSREAVMKSLSSIFGRSGNPKEVDRSVYCGAGERPN